MNNMKVFFNFFKYLFCGFLPGKFFNQDNMNVNKFIHFTFRYIFVIIILVNSCDLFKNDTNDNKPIALEGTEWQLEYIKSEEGSVFYNEEDSVWIPESVQGVYYINFFSDDSVTNHPSSTNHYCISCRGDYRIYNSNKISINWDCFFLPRLGCGNMQVMIMIDSATTFQLDEKELRLSVDKTEGWNKSTMYFKKQE